MKYPTVLLVWVTWLFSPVHPHAMLRVPPQRSSMFREGFPVPSNYDDNGLNCGGFTNQFSTNGGKCGVCGDPYQGPRPNEAGGKYATGIIARNYTKGEIIDAVVKITANHLGYFEFRLCPIDNATPKVTQWCLDQRPLKIEQDSKWKTRYYPGSHKGELAMRVKLPDELTCTRCVIQWKYRAGNTWECNDEEGCCLGCGPQEHFINCADIAIASTSHTSTTVSPVNSTTSDLQTSPTTEPSSTSQSSTTVTSTSATTKTASTSVTEKPVTTSPTSATQPPKSTSSKPPTSGCTERAGWGHLHPWCSVNCALGNCPSSLCICVGDDPDPFERCHAIGMFAGNEIFTAWCIVNCRLHRCSRAFCYCP